MLRYYGCPCAAYAEGFRVGRGSVSSGGIATIRDYDEHAWVEIYDPYLGWIPLEFTGAPFDHSQSETGSSSPGEADTPDDPSADPAAPTPVTGDQPSSPDPAQQEQLQVPAAGRRPEHGGPGAAHPAAAAQKAMEKENAFIRRIRERASCTAIISCRGWHATACRSSEEALALANQARFSRSGADGRRCLGHGKADPADKRQSGSSSLYGSDSCSSGKMHVKKQQMPHASAAFFISMTTCSLMPCVRTG